MIFLAKEKKMVMIFGAAKKFERMLLQKFVSGLKSFTHYILTFQVLSFSTLTRTEFRILTFGVFLNVTFLTLKMPSILSNFH